MFTTGLIADGTEPASHFISSGPIANEFGDLLPLHHRLTKKVRHNPPGDVATVEAIADQAGITPARRDDCRTVRRD